MDSIPQQLLLQAILILINAFFAMTEIAVISLNPGKLRMLAEEGDKTAPRLLKLVEIEDARMASSVTEMLMGSEVPPRRAFIYENATEAELDI